MAAPRSIHQLATAYCPGCMRQAVPLDDGRCSWCQAQTGGAVRTRRPEREGLRAPHLAGPRPQKISPAVLAEARALYATGLSIRKVAAEILDRTGYANERSCANGLFDQFKARGWPLRDRVQAAVAAHTRHGLAARNSRGTPEHRELRRQQRRATGEIQDRPLCKGVRLQYPRKGAPCQNRALAGSEYCRAHDPAKRAEVVEHTAQARAAIVAEPS